MELVLQPEHLGKIQMLLQSSDGIVSVQILAQTSEALNLLNANSHSIKDAIEQQGIELNDVNINLAQNSQDQPTHQEGRSDNTSTIPNVPHERIPKVNNFIESTKHSDNLLNVLA
jgi:flagellar hook-length control protein FliK